MYRCLCVATAIALTIGCEQPEASSSASDTAQDTASPSADPNGFRFTDTELATHDQVNDYRASKRLPPLAADPVLGALAREHSERMLAGIVPFSHQGFNQRADEILDSGGVSAAENVAYSMGYDDPVGVAVDGWIGSPGHEANMSGAFTHGGVGVATDGVEIYFTHLFTTRR